MIFNASSWLACLEITSHDCQCFCGLTNIRTNSVNEVQHLPKSNKVNCGVPQGSILSPALFNLHMPMTHNFTLPPLSWWPRANPGPFLTVFYISHYGRKSSLGYWCWNCKHWHLTTFDISLRMHSIIWKTLPECDCSSLKPTQMHDFLLRAFWSPQEEYSSFTITSELSCMCAN